MRLYFRNPDQRWLGKLSINWVKEITRIKDSDYMNRAWLSEGINHIDYNPEDSKSVPMKYIIIIKMILEHTECRAIWVQKISLIDSEPYVTFTIYGYGKDPEIASDLIHYFVEGIRLAESNVQKEKRRLNRNNRRRKNFTGKFENARTYTDRIIKAKIKEFEKFIIEYPVKVSPDKELKMGNIFKYINLVKKIDLKKYKNLSQSTIYSSTARIDKRHINRLI